ncbi:MAG: nicotinamide riboside transporter PnuC [Clostridium sp.]|uniref:nicotinamide riboside transporter PnuC n=1 Tax=Clostridium sp. TaxID=1506 RepID=UPI003F341341
MKNYNFFNTLTKFEFCLWILSIAVVTISFVFVGKGSILTLCASLIGVTALIFVAKGHVFGQVLTVLFSLFYALISYQFQYYGEMITYLGMTTPIAIMSVVSWLKHPYKGEKAEVEIAHLSKKNIMVMIMLTIVVTFCFYFILAYFDTANLTISTISIATSFLASYLMLFRSSAYAMAYGANDIVLIILWILATIENVSFFPMVICFIMFLCNDIYGFYNWTKMKHKQSKN